MWANIHMRANVRAHRDQATIFQSTTKMLQGLRTLLVKLNFQFRPEYFSSLFYLHEPSCPACNFRFFHSALFSLDLCFAFLFQLCLSSCLLLRPVICLALCFFLSIDLCSAFFLKFCLVSRLFGFLLSRPHIYI